MGVFPALAQRAKLNSRVARAAGRPEGPRDEGQNKAPNVL